MKMLVVNQDNTVVFQMDEMVEIDASGYALLVSVHNNRSIIGGIFTKNPTAAEVLRDLVAAYERGEKIFRIPKWNLAKAENDSEEIADEI